MAAADLVFTGGAVFDGAAREPLSLSVAIRDGKILQAAPHRDIEPLIDERTEVIELDGALLSPGFQDAHVHPIGGGIELLLCNLTEAGSADEAVLAVTEYAAAHPDDGWILGGGWTMSHFEGGAPRRELLDAAAPGRRVLLLSRDHHSTWASTAAIDAAGIDAATPDPADGRIERDEHGLPSGTFHEGAGALFDGVRPAYDQDLAYAGLLRAQDELLALGITGWQDALIGEELGLPDILPAYLRAVREGTLRVHVDGAQWWVRDQDASQICDMEERRQKVSEEIPDGSFRLPTVKMMLDGITESQTASMLAPYRDGHGHATSSTGLTFIPAAALPSYVAQLDAAGFQVHFHALGDRAVRDALDAIEYAADTNGTTDRRHHLAHLQVIADDDVTRFEKLDATANMQALWAAHEEATDALNLPFLPEGAAARQYPFGDLLRADARLAAGSDWPVSSADPIAAIHVAVNRRTPSEPAQPPLGGDHQRLPLCVAWAAYTAGSAFVSRRERETGYLREGYDANLIVVSPNPFDVPEADIHASRVVGTWVRGVRV